MSLEPPLINIAGMSRYDLPACKITNNKIQNWKYVKDKINLSEKEQEKFYRSINNTQRVKATENKSPSSIILEFNKKIDQSEFNTILRNFINVNKICSKCRCPELVDSKCNACGHGVTTILVEDTIVKKELTKQEKRANKIKIQQEKDKVTTDELPTIEVDTKIEVQTDSSINEN
jgi:hypothetical protein